MPTDAATSAADAAAAALFGRADGAAPSSAAAAAAAAGSVGAGAGAAGVPPAPPVVLSPADEAAAFLAKRVESLKVQRFQDLCALVPERHLARAVGEMCATMVDVLVMHYLMMQWHRCPLDPRNLDTPFLRRCGVNAPDAPGDRKPPESDEDAELYSVLLMGFRKDMLDTRGPVWTAIQQRLGQLFFAVVGHVGAALQVEYLTAALSVTHKFMDIGNEYSNSDSRVLAGSLRLLCSQFVDVLCSDSIDYVSKLMKKDLWERMPLTPESLRTALTGLTTSTLRLAPIILAQACAATGDDSRLGELQTGEDQIASQLAGVPTEGADLLSQLQFGGKPLADDVAASMVVASSSKRGMFGAEAGEEGGEEEEEEEVVDADAEEEDEDALEPMSSTRAHGASGVAVEDGFSVSFVVTGVALNGFARYAGKLYAVVHCLPHVAASAFAGLQRLFDLYYFTVVTSFVPQIALHSLFSHFEALEAAHSDGGPAGRPAGTVDNVDAYTYRDPMSVIVATLVTKDIQLSKVETTKISMAVTAQEQANLAKRILSGDAGDEAGAGAGGSGRGRDDRVFKTMYTTLCQIRDDLESGRMGPGLAVAGRRGPVDIQGLGVAHIPFSFVPLQAVAGFDVDPSTGFGLPQRCIAVESLQFVEHVLKMLLPMLEKVLPPSYHQALRAFVGRVSKVVVESRGFMYAAVLPRLLPEAMSIPAWIQACRWEIREATEPNVYVKQVGDAMERVARLLDDLTRRGALPSSSRSGVWACAVGHVMLRVVEGFSRVKKCSTAGRGLMQLDVKNLWLRIARVLTTSPDSIVRVRDSSYVVDYVQAFYNTTETDVMPWILQHKERYLGRHLRSIVENGIGPSLKSARVKELLASIDQMKTLTI